MSENQSLKSNVLSWRSQFFQAIAHMAPASGIVMSFQFMATRSGSALPLAVVCAAVLSLLVAYCLSLLTRKYFGASGYFQIHSRALGSKVGFTTSWLFFIYEPLNAFMSFFGFGVLILEPFSQAHLGYKIPWWVAIVVGNSIIMLCSLTNIKGAMRVTTILGIVEVIIFLVFGGILLVQADAPFQPQYFAPGNSADGIGGLLFAFIFAFFLFMGFESGLPLTEETKDTRKSTAKGLLLSVGFGSLLFIFLGYAFVVGFGGGEDSVSFAKNFGSAHNPFSGTLAIKAFGAIGPWLIFFAVLNSCIACALASQSGSSRVFFSLGRSRVLPKWLGYTTVKNNVPANASLFAGFLTFLFGVVFYLLSHGQKIMDWFGFTAVLMTIALLALHFITCLSVFVAYRFKEKDGFKHIQHGLIPLVTAGIVLLPLCGSVYYNPDKPMSYAPWVVGIWFVIGLVVYNALKRRQPQTLQALEHEMERFGHARERWE